MSFGVHIIRSNWKEGNHETHEMHEKEWERASERSDLLPRRVCGLRRHISLVFVHFVHFVSFVVADSTVFYVQAIS